MWKEGKRLKTLGELPENIKINENVDLTEKEDEEDIGIDIMDEDEVAAAAAETAEEIRKEKFKNEFDNNFKYI